MADQLLTASGALSAIVPEVWSARYTENLNDKIVYNSLIRRDYEGEISQLGDTVRIPTIADVAAVNVPEGGKADAITVSASTTSLVINRQATVDFTVTNIAQLQSISFMDRLRDLAISAIMRFQQDDIIAAISPSTSSPDHTIAYDTANTLADVDLLEVLDLERTANWPDDGKYLITGGAQYDDLLNITKFYDKTINSGDSIVTSGKVLAPVYGHSVDWTTANGNTTFLFHDSFMQMAVQKALSIAIHDIGGTGVRAFRINVDVLYGIKQIHSDRVISLS